MNNAIIIPQGIKALTTSLLGKPDRYMKNNDIGRKAAVNVFENTEKINAKGERYHFLYIVQRETKYNTVHMFS